MNVMMYISKMETIYYMDMTSCYEQNGILCITLKSYICKYLIGSILQKPILKTRFMTVFG